MSIKVYYEKEKFRLKESGRKKKQILKVIESENRTSGDLCFIFTDDLKMIVLNKSFLGKDYFTDVIAFDYSVGKIISGDIFISIDTVRRNAINYNVSFSNELLRVMIHGVLHLCGYKDNTIKSKEKMRKSGDRWLKDNSGSEKY